MAGSGDGNGQEDPAEEEKAKEAIEKLKQAGKSSNPVIRKALEEKQKKDKGKDKGK